MPVTGQGKFHYNPADKTSVGRALEALKVKDFETLNDGGMHLRAGHVVGIDSNHTIRLAKGGTNYIRAAGVAVSEADGGTHVALRNVGYLSALVEASILPARGDPVFISTDEPGTVTNVPPDEGAQREGMFWSNRNADRAWISFVNDPSILSDIGGAGAGGGTGADGEDGVDGAQGVQGIQGIQGVAGADGTNGTNGTNGADGADGADGIGTGGIGVPEGGLSTQYLVGPNDWETKAWTGSTGTSGSPGGGVATIGGVVISEGALQVTGSGFTLFTAAGHGSISAPNGTLSVGTSAAAGTVKVQGNTITLYADGLITIGGVITIGGDPFHVLTGPHADYVRLNTGARFQDPDTGFVSYPELILEPTGWQEAPIYNSEEDYYAVPKGYADWIMNNVHAVAFFSQYQHWEALEQIASTMAGHITAYHSE